MSRSADFLGRQSASFCCANVTGNEILGLRTNGNVKDRDTSKAARRRDGGKDGNRRGRKRNVKRLVRVVLHVSFRYMRSHGICNWTAYVVKKPLAEKEIDASKARLYLNC